MPREASHRGLTIPSASMVSSFDFSLPLPRVEDLSDTPAVPYVPSPAPLFLRPAAPKSYAQMPLVKSEEKSDFRALPEVVAALPGYFLVEGFSCVEFLQLQAPFVMVDQAAVRARLIFDQLIAKAGRVVSQGLLIPHSFSLTPVDSALLQSHLEALEKSGFSIHASGPQSFLLEALPQVLSTVSLNDLMADIVAGIAEKSASETVQERVGKRLSYLAARNASGKMRLSLDECRLLLKQLFAHQISYYCPKGKPIFAPLRVEDLERLFQSLSS